MVDFQFSGLNIPDPDGPEHSDAAKETILESEQPDVAKQTILESDVTVVPTDSLPTEIADTAKQTIIESDVTVGPPRILYQRR